MPLAAGQSLSYYEILDPLGAGGMGEVYRARDTRLDREVAIKVLPEELADDEERLRRFEREAKMLASLNHPNVAGIHGVDQVDDVCFLALELVPGEDLAKRLSRGPLSVDEAIDVCRQIAEGLEAAHEAGVVHRDLKPANVRITPEGVVKVLDFGLAKPSVQDAGSGSSTGANPDSFLVTSEGMVLGTPTYMSPEQARGRAVDKRTDVWAFGCVLYECLTGRRAFEGEAFGDLMVEILERDVDLDALPPEAPRRIRRLISRCLAKDPRRRLRDLGDARIELESSEDEGDPFPVPSDRQRSHATSTLVGVGLALVGLGWFVGRAMSPTGSVVADRFESLRFSAVTDREGEEISPTLSPDGNFVVYEARTGDGWDLYSQRVGGSVAQNLTAELEGDQTGASFSPDGELIAFRSEHGGGGIFVMGATGESPRRVTDDGYDPSWSLDGKRLAYASRPTIDPTARVERSQLVIVDVETGDRRTVEVPDAMQPVWSPNGRWIAFWGIADGGNRDLWIVPADGGEARRLTDDEPTDWSPRWTPDGAEIWFASDRGGVTNLWRLGVDPESGDAVGAPRALTRGVGSAISSPSFSADGSRVAFGAHTSDEYLARVGFDAERLEVIGTPERIAGTRFASNAALSSDGDWIVFKRDRKQEDIFVVSTDGTKRRQITNDTAKDRTPVWSPDGSRIYFQSDRSGLYQIWSCAPDGSDLVQLSQSASNLLVPEVSPDGTRVVLSSLEGELFYLDADPEKEKQTPVPGPAYREEAARLKSGSYSPDGRWICVVRLDGVPHLVLLDLESDTYERLMGGDREAGGPQARFELDWLPDSSGIIVLLDDRSVARIDLEERKPRTIVGLPRDEINGVQVSPDGRWLYLQMLEVGSDVWIAEVESVEADG